MSEGRNLSFVAFYNLDIYVPLLAFVSLLAYVAYFVVRKTVSLALLRLSPCNVSNEKKVQ